MQIRNFLMTAARESWCSSNCHRSLQWNCDSCRIYRSNRAWSKYIIEVVTIIYLFNHLADCPTSLRDLNESAKLSSPMMYHFQMIRRHQQSVQPMRFRATRNRILYDMTYMVVYFVIVHFGYRLFVIVHVREDASNGCNVSSSKVIVVFLWHCFRVASPSTERYVCHLSSEIREKKVARHFIVVNSMA